MIATVWRTRKAELALLLAAVAVFEGAFLFERIASEGADRRDQSCQLFEGEHLADVMSLRRAYGYLAGLPESERGLSINQLLMRLLPDAEQRARRDRAPSYCDGPGVGLPEPDPVVPDRPPGL